MPTAAELVRLAKQIKDRNKPQPLIEPIQQDLPTQADTSLTNMAQASPPQQPPQTIQAAPPQPQLSSQNVQQQLSGPTQPSIERPGVDQNPLYQRLTSMLDASNRPAQGPQTWQGQVGNLLGNFGRYGWMDPAKAQALELERQKDLTSGRRANQQELVNQLKMLEEKDWRERQAGLTEEQRQIENRRADIAQAAQATQATAPKYLNVPPENTVLNERTGQPVFTGPPKPRAETSVGAYTNAQGQHVQIMRHPTTGALREQVLGDVLQPDQNVVVRTVDAQGKPIEKIVPKKPGAEYPAAPTVQETNRRDQATIVNNYADHILQLIDQNPNAVGPILGRIARGEVALGNVPDQVKALHTALGSFEALQPILHGFRGGSQTVDHFHTVIGDQHLNAAALKASINEIKNLAKTIDPSLEGQSGTQEWIRGNDGKLRPK